MSKPADEAQFEARRRIADEVHEAQFVVRTPSNSTVALGLVSIAHADGQAAGIESALDRIEHVLLRIAEALENRR